MEPLRLRQSPSAPATPFFWLPHSAGIADENRILRE